MPEGINEIGPSSDARANWRGRVSGAIQNANFSGGVVLGGDFEELATVLDGDVAALGKKLAIEVLAGEEPLGEVGAGLSVGSGEANGVMVAGVTGDLLVGGLAVVDSEDCTLDGDVVGVEEVHDTVSGPDGVGGHCVDPLSFWNQCSRLGWWI